MNLPEKKAAVFRAVLKLLRQGRPLGDLKVSEIAEAAGIGKGTVYEYFPSREGKYSYTVPLPMPAASAISETFKSPSGRPCRSSFNTARNTAAFFSGKFIPLLPPR